jgi:integrase
MDRDEAFAIIRAARAQITTPRPPVSASTAALYDAMISRAKGKDPDGWTSWVTLPTKSSAYLRKAALRHHFLFALGIFLHEQDQIQKNNNDFINDKGFIKKIKNIEKIIKIADDNSIFSNKTRSEKGIYTSKIKPKSKSKRRALSKLPDDFHEKLVEKIGENVDLLLFIDVLKLTGMRPAEYQKASLKVLKNKLIVTINGVKTNAGHGQKMRILTISGDSASAIRVIKTLGKYGDFNKRLDDKSRAAAEEKIARASVSLFSIRVSPYTYRHFVASDLKKAGRGKVEIAKVLGHAVTETQKKYGKSGLGKGGCSIEACTTMKEPRQNDSSSIHGAPDAPDASDTMSM